MDLRNRDTALAGGENGPPIRPGRPDDSLLWQKVDGDEMPPDKPLSPHEKSVLKQWIAGGAGWGTDPIDPLRYTSSTRAGYDWWSLQPIHASKLPWARSADWAQGPIDCFIQERLVAAGLRPSVQADRRTKARRLFLDLVGLPPTPDEVVAFLHCEEPDAYDRLVDRLLASPRFGERWARHWLDVARYGESDGFERNARRPDSWPYRDWVISALNSDMSYDQFCRWQIAGDILHPESLDAIYATGFLVAGVHNTVLGNDKMRAIARQDELEDMIGAVGQTFLGLTVNCGRCHDHKFDPVSQRDYYRLASALSGARHGVREIVVASMQAAAARVAGQIKELSERLSAIEEPVARKILADRILGRKSTRTPPVPFAAWDLESGLRDRAGVMHLHAIGKVATNSGGVVLDGKSYLRSEPISSDFGEKTLEAWVRLENGMQRGGGVISLATPDGSTFDAIVFGEQEPGRWMAGSNGFVRYRSFGGPEDADANSRMVHVAIVYRADGTIQGYRNGAAYGKPYRSMGLQKYSARGAVVLIGCRHEPAGGNKMLSGVVARARLYNRALAPEEVAASAEARGAFVADNEITERMEPKAREERDRLRTLMEVKKKEHAILQSQSVKKAYAAVPEDGEPTRVLARGDLSSPGEVVSAGGVAALSPALADFHLNPDAPDAQRRLRLVEWITNPANPLFARVLVNRLWHYHFGLGLVETPNDFGFNGGRPSHPELLDWLAADFIEGGLHWKRVHRTIVTSSAYRQSSGLREDARRLDADARLLWRKKPLRVEAEVLRDGMLAVAGLFNDEIGGPGFSDYRVIDAMNGTAYYQPYDPAGAEFHRRSIYRFVPRGASQGLLDAFDCPDPASAAPRRNATTTPLQALSLWNGAFSLRMARALAERIDGEAPAITASKVARAYQLTLQRDPLPEERSAAVELVERHGLPTLCRALFNANEFLTIE